MLWYEHGPHGRLGLMLEQETSRTCSKLCRPTVWPRAAVTGARGAVQNEGAGQAGAGGLRRHAVRRAAVRGAAAADGRPRVAAPAARGCRLGGRGTGRAAAAAPAAAVMRPGHRHDSSPWASPPALCRCSHCHVFDLQILAAASSDLLPRSVRSPPGVGRTLIRHCVFGS